MPSSDSKILVTGAHGHLGGLAVRHLLDRVPASRLIATARDAGALSDLAERGVEVRQADYDDSASLDRALAGVDRLLLVSANIVGQRARQHRNVIDAAKRAGIGFIAYTSILHADTNGMQLAGEHLATEGALRESGIPFALLRNGWYSENYTASAPAAVQHGVVLGAAKDGRFSFATRTDYAEAAAVVIASDDDQRGRVYELAGDEAHSLPELAAAYARQSGKQVVYRDVPEAELSAALKGFGLPPAIADVLADSDVQAARGVLRDDDRQLSRLIGRPTTPLAQSVAEALSGGAAPQSTA